MLKLFSFIKNFILLKFFAKQLSTNSPISLFFIVFKSLFFFEEYFFYFLKYISIFSNSFNNNFLSPLDLLTRIFIVSEDIEIFFLKNLLAKLANV